MVHDFDSSTLRQSKEYLCEFQASLVSLRSAKDYIVSQNDHSLIQLGSRLQESGVRWPRNIPGWEEEKSGPHRVIPYGAGAHGQYWNTGAGPVSPWVQPRRERSQLPSGRGCPLVVNLTRLLEPRQ